MIEKQKKPQPEPGSSRRKFLLNVAAGSAAGLTGASTLSVAEANAVTRWDRVADIVVVGSGAAASVAAIMATHAGNSVLIVEKAPVYGGTSAKSDGGYWIPNNRFMREQGIEDERNDALRYMARCAHPHLYRSDDQRFGLSEEEYGLLGAFYDYAGKAVDFLDEVGALKSGLFFHLPDYHDHASENKAPRGRLLFSKRSDGRFGPGTELIRQLKAWIDVRKIPLLFKHRVQKLVRNDRGEIVGVEAATADGRTWFMRARKAVVFGSGGYTHNPELLRNFQPGPIYGGCAIPTIEGDFIVMGQGIGAKLGNMVNAWRTQIILEQALEYPSVPRGIWQPPGDSMILVNKYGQRVVGEKRNYQDRSRIHFAYDANWCEYPNQFLFMIYDRRTAELFAGNYPLPALGSSAAYVISSSTLAGLGQSIQERLDRHAHRIGTVRLVEGFSSNIAKTIANFDRYAKSGDDEEYQRGAYPYDKEWHAAYMSVPRSDTSWKVGEIPNFTMHPFRPEGPYYAIILAAGLADTNGGPMINQAAQVLDPANRPIPGLYGAGNCIASPAGEGYWGGGASLGLAIAFGYLAGLNAARESIKTTPLGRDI